MADRYVDSNASGSANGSSWANAHLTMAAAITASTAGDRFFVAHDHNESTAASTTLSFKGTNGIPDQVLAVNKAGSVPPVAADLVSTPTANIKTTGANSLIVGGTVRFWGINFCPGFGGGGGANAAGFQPQNNTARQAYYENCKWTLNGNSGSLIVRGTGSGPVIARDLTIEFGEVSQGFNGANGASRFHWKNSASVTALTGTMPTNLFRSSDVDATWRLEGLDLSPMGSGKTLVAANDRSGRVELVNCRLHASVVVAAGPSSPSNYVDLVGCNSGSNVQRNERYGYMCSLTTETTIVRTSGANDGTTAYSWKLVSGASLKRLFPFETFEGVIWNDATGSAKTLTVHVVTDNVTLTDAEIWLEVDYLGDGSYPISTRLSDEAATPLTAGSNQASDSGTAWTTTGLTTPVKQKLEATFTPANKGPIRWRVRFAKASTTVYICPKPDLT